MSNIASAEVFHLVKALREDEEKLFNSFAKHRLKPQAMKLYQLLAGSTCNDEAVYAKQLGAHSTGTFQTIKSNLKTCLCEFLILQERKKRPFKWIHELEQCTMLFNRGRFSEAHHRTGKLIEDIKANSITKGSLLMGCAQWLNNHLISVVADDRSEEHHTANVNALLDNLMNVSESVKAYNCYLRAALLHQKDPFLRNESSRKELKALKKEPLLKMDMAQLPYDQKFFVEQALAFIAFMEGDYDRGFGLDMLNWKQRMALADERTGIAGNERMKDWNNTLDSCFFAGRAKELSNLLEEGHGLFGAAFATNPEYWNTWLVYRYRSSLLKGEPQCTTDWYDEAQEFVEAHEQNGNVSVQGKISLQFCLMLFCFFNGDLRGSLRHRHQVRHIAPKADVATSMLEVSEAFGLVIIFEQCYGNGPAQKNYIKALHMEAVRIKDRHRKKQDAYGLEMLLADFFIALTKEHDPKTHGLRFAQLKEDIAQSGIGYLTLFNKYFDLSGWIGNKIVGGVAITG
ncbi:MAG: hypothetical protein K9J06_14465 [Flavobacteriales bacterium]|nr:hypothetical protein [Flavobacteriales bacterium]